MPNIYIVRGRLKSLIEGSQLDVITAYIENNLADGEALVVHSTGEVKLGQTLVTLDHITGDFAEPLIGSNSTDINVTNLQYRLVVLYRVLGDGGVLMDKQWDSGWFDLLADVEIGAPEFIGAATPMTVAWSSAFRAEMEVLKAEAEAAAAGGGGGGAASGASRWLAPATEYNPSGLKWRQPRMNSSSGQVLSLSGTHNKSIPFMPFEVMDEMTIDRAWVQVITASAAVDVNATYHSGIYAHNVVTSKPGALLGRAEFSLTTTGAKESSLVGGVPLTLPPGIYWMAGLMTGWTTSPSPQVYALGYNTFLEGPWIAGPTPSTIVKPLIKAYPPGTWNSLPATMDGVVLNDPNNDLFATVLIRTT